MIVLDETGFPNTCTILGKVLKYLVSFLTNPFMGDSKRIAYIISVSDLLAIVDTNTVLYDGLFLKL